MEILVLCAEIIWLSKTTSTYCMRKKGHTGEHNIEDCEPPAKVKKTQENDGQNNK